MTAEKVLQILSDNLTAEPWIDQVSTVKKLICIGDPKIIGDTYYAMLQELHDAMVIKDAKMSFIMLLALQKYCEIYVDHHKPVDPSRN